MNDAIFDIIVLSDVVVIVIEESHLCMIAWKNTVAYGR